MGHLPCDLEVHPRKELVVIHSNLRLQPIALVNAPATQQVASACTKVRRPAQMIKYCTPSACSAAYMLREANSHARCSIIRTAHVCCFTGGDAARGWSSHLLPKLVNEWKQRGLGAGPDTSTASTLSLNNRMCMHVTLRQPERPRSFLLRNRHDKDSTPVEGRMHKGRSSQALLLGSSRPRLLESIGVMLGCWSG